MKWLVWVLIAVEAAFMAAVLLFGAGLRGFPAVLLVVGTVVFGAAFGATYLRARNLDNRIDDAAAILIVILESGGNAVTIDAMARALNHDDLWAAQRQVRAYEEAVWSERRSRGEVSER